MTPALKSKLPYLSCMAILVIMCSVYYSYIIGSLPMGIHEWAQSDRLSIAYRYYDDGMNFFLPATLNMEPIDGVVGVEFPIQAYLAASLAHLFGRSTISICFRLLDISIMCTGLLFLFHIVYKRTRDFTFSIIPVIFMACIPVYLYYSGNFMPDPASVSLTLIGFSFLFNYFDTPSRVRSLYIALLWLTLAAMIKTTAINYLGCVMAFCFFDRLSKYRTLRSVWPLTLVSLGCLLIEGANLAMMRYLHLHYNSWLFTTSIHPFRSWESFVSFVENNYKMYWMTEYLSLPQYTVYVLLVVTGGCLGFRYKDYRLGRLMLMFLAGALLLAYLFGDQLNIHDYYILAIFYPLLAFALVLSVLNLQRAFAAATPQLSRAVRIALVSTMLLLFFFTDHQLYQRQTGTGTYTSAYASTWMQGGAETLNKLHIPRAELIGTFDEDSPNLPLIYFDRRGYTLGKTRWSGNASVAAGWMRGLHINLAVCPEQTIRRIMNDSTFQQTFNILSLENNKAVLQLKTPPLK